ncbi:hypothetical protein [Caldimonas sp. KR1-144]|uniref:hypothetical protein n=1 Tax=Caldimonas sp. KR1-144 TaxID=3400911 RepID=UPI003BFC18AD
MSEAQRRRELADRLGLYICDEHLCESYADAMMDAAEILRSDAAALEAVGAEPIGYFYELESANEKAGPIWQGCESEAVCDVVAADIERKSFPLYGPDVALRLAEARQALRKIAAIEDKMFGGDWDEISEAREIACNALGVGHE